MLKKGKLVLRVVAFLVVFTFVLVKVQNVIVPKSDWPVHDNRRTRTISGAFLEPENSLDVIWMGTSHVFAGVSPMEIYRQSNIYSYDLSVATMRLKVGYYLLQEVLKKQSPKLVFLDASAFFYTEEQNMNKNRWQENMNALPLTSIVTRVKMAADLAKLNGEPFGDEYIHRSLLPIMQYHTNYLLTSSDFINEHYDQIYYRKGYVLKSKITPATEERMEIVAQLLADDDEEDEDTVSDSQAAEVLAGNKGYIQEYADLCNARGIELVLYKVPVFTGEKSRGHWSKQKHDIVQGLADELGVKFLDLNYEDTGLEWLTDSIDGGGHMNLSGATKVSIFLANWLMENYDFGVHDNEEWNAMWDYQLQLYDWERGYYTMQMEQDILRFFDRVSDGNFTLFTTVNGGVGEGWTDEVQARFERLTGSTVDPRNEESAAYASVSAGGEIIKEKVGKKETSFHGTLEDGNEYKLTSAVKKADDAGEIRVAGVKNPSKGQGIHFVVYDNDLRCIVDNATFNVYDGKYVGLHDASTYATPFRLTLLEHSYQFLKEM